MNGSQREEDGDREARDAALIDRLYGDSDDADLGELRSVRALIARIREEAPVAEPSPAISATLLQAARERAPKEGWWARFRAWMMPISAHPALAAAATLVVVAGAAALWMRGGGEVAEPTRGPAPEWKSEAKEADSFETEGTLAEPPRKEDPTQGLADEPGAPPEERAPEPEVARPQKRKPPATAGARDREEQEKKLENDQLADKDEKPAVIVTGRVDGQVGGGKGDAEKKKVPVVDAPPPPPPQAPPEPTADDSAGSPAEEVTVTGTSEQRAPSSADQARAVTRKARVEAEKNNCKNTSAYGTEVKNLDKTVYDRDFVKDRAIDACLRRGRAKTTTKSGQ